MAKAKKANVRIVSTLREVATALDFSSTAVSDWARKGMPGKPGRYDLDAIQKWRQDNFKRRPENNLINSRPNSVVECEIDQNDILRDKARLLKAQADREEALARQEELKTTLQQEAYAKLDDVNVFISEFLSHLRGLLSRIPVEGKKAYGARAAFFEKDIQKRHDLILNQMHDWMLRTAELETESK